MLPGYARLFFLSHNRFWIAYSVFSGFSLFSSSCPCVCQFWSKYSSFSPLEAVFWKTKRDGLALERVIWQTRKTNKQAHLRKVRPNENRSEDAEEKLREMKNEQWTPYRHIRKSLSSFFFFLSSHLFLRRCPFNALNYYVAQPGKKNFFFCLVFWFALLFHSKLRCETCFLFSSERLCEPFLFFFDDSITYQIALLYQER